jgi:predicted Fe-S protein YdhL (DUF1289 family)
VSEPSPVSPCIGVCTLDPVSLFCQGCLRTIEEIARWPRLTTEEKRRVLASLPARRAGEQGSHAVSGHAPG